MSYKSYSICIGASALLVLSALRLPTIQPPNREDFAKYSTFRQKWFATCDLRSDLAKLNDVGCKNLHEWQAANNLPILDNLMNQNLGK